MDALREVWHAHHEAMRRFARHLCGDASRADDLVQEAFVRLWTTHAPIRTETLRAYLFAIVRNLHRRAARREARDDGPVPDVIDTSPPADELAIQRDDTARVRRALAELDDDDRSALWMRVDGELSYEDIGAALGISAGAARVRVHRARRRLLESMRREEMKHERRDA